jgi:hypothetical protein
METVELTFQYSRKEYIKAMRQYFFARRILRKFDVVLVPLALAFSTALLVHYAFSPLSVAFFALIVVWLIMTCVLYFYTPYNNFKQIQKLHDWYNLSFSETSIRFNTAKIASELQWSIYSEAWENKEFYFLIQQPQLYTLLPKRAFTPEQEETFKKILASVFPRIKQID